VCVWLWLLRAESKDVVVCLMGDYIVGRSSGFEYCRLYNKLKMVLASSIPNRWMAMFMKSKYHVVQCVIYVPIFMVWANSPITINCTFASLI